jgi:MFS family permease
MASKWGEKMEEFQKAHARKISIVEGAFATVWGQFTGAFGGNSYLAGFFLWLGASPFAMSIYNSVFALANVLQPFLLVFTKKFKSKKELVTLFTWISRPSFIFFLFVPFMMTGLRVWVAIIVLFVVELMVFAVGAVWRSWMSEVVDFKSMGKYFGIRNLVSGAVAIPSLLVAGYLLDALGRGYLAFSVLFSIGVVFGIIESYIFRFQDEDETKREPVFNLHAMFEVIKIPGNYRKYLAGFTLWNFSAALIGPYPVVMLIEEFKYDYATLSILSVTLTVFSTLFQPIWGKFGDKYGSFKMLKMALFLQTILAFMWFSAIPSLYYIGVLYALIGIFVTSGVFLSSFNALMEIAPSFGKTEAFSLFISVTSGAAVLGNICSGIFALSFSDLHITLWIWNVDMYRMIFLLSFIARILASLYFFNLKIK